MNILIVDDSKAMRMIVRRTLRQAGYEVDCVREACNGVEGLSAVQEDAPDLILCDWNMPEMSGIDFLASLRSSGFQTKFGFITSESTIEMREKASQAGALFLISKPFTADNFQEHLDPILGSS